MLSLARAAFIFDGMLADAGGHAIAARPRQASC
jgi:hypothetical protein